MKKVLGSAALAIGLALSGTAKAETTDLGGFEAYFVFVGAINGDYQDNTAAARKIEMDAERCGMEALNDFSFKFSEREDMIFFFLADYYAPEVHGTAAKEKAEAARDLVKKCIPDAYVKKTWYSGE